MDDKEKQDYIRVVMLCQPGIKEKLDEMCEKDHRKMSMFLNILVDEEYARRQQQ